MVDHSPLSASELSKMGVIAEAKTIGALLNGLSALLDMVLLDRT
jgi:hypothetical protein